jgi:hypothetical protein
LKKSTRPAQVLDGKSRARIQGFFHSFAVRTGREAEDGQKADGRTASGRLFRLEDQP